MADYRKMYALLCRAIDKEVDTLRTIPLAYPSAERLADALRKAEELYIDTAEHIEETDDEKILAFRAAFPSSAPES